MEILAGIASKLGELLVVATVKEARYLFCFNSIVKELEDKETNLKEEKDGINERVEQERQKHCAIDIDENVGKWLKIVDKEMADVQTLKAKIAEKKSCLNGWCPNWGCRYWMGRKASKETRKLSDLLQDRSKFSTVARPKPLPLERELSLPSYFTSTFETTESACNQITEALKKDSTKMVGLHGLGGVGKTTLAKSVGNQLRQQKIFDKVGIAAVSQDPDIIKVQGELAKSLGWELKEKDEKERADRLRLMFSSESKSSKILVILDDVWKPLDLEKKLGITVGGRDNCCKILLTTRKKSVCDSLGCDTQIPLSTLTPEEGLALLRKTARINVNDSTLNDVSEEVAGECNEWYLALHNLKVAKLYEIEGIDKDDQDVYGCLKFSYDNLNDDNSKLCFLSCSLFPEDYEIDLEDLVGYAVGLTWYQAESIENTRILLHGTIDGLKAASLLLDTDNDRFVKMHDVVRDVALWIGSEQKKFFTSKFGIFRLAERAVEQYRGISLVGNKKEELPSGLVCPNLHILRLENTRWYNKFQVPEKFFEGMPALKVVTIIGGVLSVKSLHFLADNLRVLRLIQCDVGDASFLGKLKRLQILDLPQSLIQIPDGLGDELSGLKLLYNGLGYSISPITIKKISQLEEFYGSIKIWEVEGMSSEESYDGYAESVVCLPKDFSFPKLKRYDINRVYNTFVIKRGTRRLGIQDNHKATLVIFSALYPELENLYLRSGRGCYNIVPSIDERGLNELIILDVRDCKDLECIMDASKSPHGKCGNPVMLSRLAELSIWGLPELKWIWKAPAQHVISLQSLTKLSVSECNNLTYIFTLPLARSLVQLKSLKVTECERLECLVEAKFDHNEGEISVGDGNTMLELPLLRELSFKDLPELMSFCSENYYLTWPALEELDLASCPKLTVNSTEHEANLQYLEEKLRILTVDKCSHLRDTIDALLKHGLKNLEELSICQLGVQVVFQVEDLECIMDTPKSPHGNMSELPKLKWIWKAPGQHVISLQSLTKLSVSECNNLTYIFTLSQAQSLVQLKSLKVSYCKRLECIVEAKFDHNEREISVGDGNTIFALPSLRKLRFEDLPELISFCSENYYSTWPALEELDVTRCPKLTVNSTELEANLQYLGEKLKILRVRECSHLRDTIDALLKHGLKNLAELHIISQLRIQVEAFVAEGQENKLFPCLNRLTHNLGELQLLFSLQSLTSLRVSVKGCTMLRRLFSSTLARNLLQLEELHISNCSELEQIIDEDEDEDHLQPVCFPKLREIYVYSCPKLKHLFHISVAPSLQKLNILFIEANDELEEVFWHKDGADVTDYNEIVMNALGKSTLSVTLSGLPNLTNFWPAGYQIPASCASHRVWNCPKLRLFSEREEKMISRILE